MAQGLVSIIIPAYGTAAYISQALDSVFAQSYGNYEVIVINDGSPDSLLLEKAIAPYRSRITYLVQHNRGPSAARNAGIERAKGEYVAILDSDDYWHPDYLASQLEVIDSDPAIDVVFSDALRVTADGKNERRFSDECPVRGELSFSRLLGSQTHVYGGVTARRDSLVRAGLYDENLRSGEDFDLWLRMLKQGRRIEYNPRVLAYYRVRPGSATSSAVPLARNMLRVLDGLRGKVELTEDERALLERQRATAAATLERMEGKEAFLRGDADTAIAKLTAAYGYVNSWKLRVTILGLRIAPRLLLGLYHLRESWSGRPFPFYRAGV
jgi:GT2 family glycosyltransferase